MKQIIFAILFNLFLISVANAANQRCTQCIDTSCYSPKQICNQDSVCEGYVACTNRCESGAWPCFQGCGQTYYPGDQNTSPYFEHYRSCLDQHCNTQCGG